MSTRSTWVKIGLAAGGALLGALLAGGGVYLWEQGRLDELADRADRAESDLAALRSQPATSEGPAEASVTPEAEPPSAQESAPVPAPEGGEGSREPAQELEPEPLQTDRQLAYVKKVSETAGNYVLVADYVQMLTGDDAVEAAEEDDSPLLDEDGTLPNDYYIRNQNTKLRTLPVAKDAFVQLLLEATPKAVALGVWQDMMPGGAGEQQAEQVAAPYWLTLKGGVVVRVEQQYLP